MARELMLYSISWNNTYKPTLSQFQALQRLFVDLIMSFWKTIILLHAHLLKSHLIISVYDYL